MVTSNNTATIQHAGPTVQDTYDAMPAEKKDVFALVVGAAMDDVVLPFDTTTQRVYANFTADEKNVLDFIVAGAQSPASSVSHNIDLVDNFLAHHGVKGMRWGVRRDDSGGSGSSSGSDPLSKRPGNTKAMRGHNRLDVKAGQASLGMAHIAALKSKGHRVVNGVLGDKTYWKRAAVIAGVTVAGVVASTVVPGLLPVGVLAGIGTHVGGAAAATASLHLTGATAAAIHAATGKAIVEASGLALTKAGYLTANTANSVSNIARAVRGNARINKSFESLGSHIYDGQRTASKQVQKVLQRNGSINKKLLQPKVVKHDAMDGSPNTGATIVALPSALDPIRLVGDEEKHATILYFGDTSSLPTDAKTAILESLATASGMFTPFSEETMGTQRLGSDVPPALVTMLAGQCLRKVRDALQINPAIVTYMQNATQYPTYQPHVTLGYPDWQGEDDLKKLISPLYAVRFDRLALWWGEERFEFDLGANDRGLARAMDSVSHDARLMLDSFLEHHGIKGMRWGVRRNLDSSGSSGSSGGASGSASAKSDKAAKKDMDKMSTGSVVPVKNADGSTKLLIKKKDGSWKETFVSVDAEKFIKSRSKEGHELSDRELKETLERARLVDNYQKMFGDQPNKELADQVASMQLQKQYKDLVKELNPPKKSMVQKFAAGSSAAYTAYNKINGITQGELGNQIAKKMREAGVPQVGNPTSGGSSSNKSSGIPKTKGFRGGTPPPSFKFTPPPGFTSRKKRTGPTPIFNISDVGKAYDPNKSYPNPFTPQIGRRGGS